ENISNPELEVKKLQLHWLLQITKAINYNLPVTNLFDIYKSVLKDHLGIGRLILFVNEGIWQIPVCYGLEGDLPLTNIDIVVHEIEKFTELNNNSSSWLRDYGTIVPVVHQDKTLAYALLGKIDQKLFPSKREIISYIHTITNLIVVAIENKRMAKESLRQAAMERELELAAQMQSMLFPASLVDH
ncbi:MAG TPA: hypothetical protein PKD91_07040, partial [Bacteroidia bacterium]|nr:hypothetical protein [Bacteroidia bacterium]